jgi:hypothetical protein
MAPDELLSRLSGTLRSEIGPAIEALLPRTQAFMAAVVLDKLARQQQLAQEHAAADRADLDRLYADLGPQLAAGDVPPPVARAFEAARADGGYAALCPLIEALYASRPALGEARFDDTLGRVRLALRGRLDRQLVYSS